MVLVSDMVVDVVTLVVDTVVITTQGSAEAKCLASAKGNVVVTTVPKMFAPKVVGQLGTLPSKRPLAEHVNISCSPNH